MIPLDATDRVIVAALLRNGRASWRLIAQATGLQERTVARRATALLEQQLVRVTAFVEPLHTGGGYGFLLELSLPPEQIDEVGRWLSIRPEVLWVLSLQTESKLVAECFFDDAQLETFILHDISGFGVNNVSFFHLHKYFRTVQGWQPGILTDAQLSILGQDESLALSVAHKEFRPLDEVELRLLDLLDANGRMSIDAIASATGASKATVRKKIQVLMQSGILSIRAVVDPSLLGYPYEVLATFTCRHAHIDHIGQILSSTKHCRWASYSSTDGSIRALLAYKDHHEMASNGAKLESLIGFEKLSSMKQEPILTMYKRSAIILADEKKI